MKKPNLFNKNIITKAVITAAVMTSAQASAAGFQINTQSASALANANAGFAASTENAAVIATNPAAAASFDKFAFSFGGAYAEPTVETKGQNAPLAAGYQGLNSIGNNFTVPEASDYDVENSVNPATIPSIYAVIPVGEKLAIGIAGYTNYGTNTEFPEDYSAGLLGGSTSLTTFNLNPSLAMKLGSKLRIGVGANLVYGTAELERNLGDAVAGKTLSALSDAGNAAYANARANGQSHQDAQIAAATTINTALTDPAEAEALAGMGKSIQAFQMEGDDFGIGWNAGLLLDLNENHKIGASYRSPVELTFEGDYSNYEGAELAAELDLTLPAMAELGGFHRFGNVAFLYGVVWTEWSSFEGLEGVAAESVGLIPQGATVFKKDYTYEDNMRYSVGLNYYLGSKVILRAGYAIDEKAGDTTISIPDSDRQWYTAGVTFKLGQTLSLDLAAAYIQGEEVAFTETDSNTGLTYAFTNKAEAIVGSAQINMVF